MAQHFSVSHVLHSSYHLARYRCLEEGARSDRLENQPEDDGTALTSSSSTEEVERLRQTVELYHPVL